MVLDFGGGKRSGNVSFVPKNALVFDFSPKLFAAFASRMIPALEDAIRNINRMPAPWSSTAKRRGPGPYFQVTGNFLSTLFSDDGAIKTDKFKHPFVYYRFKALVPFREIAKGVRKGMRPLVKEMVKTERVVTAGKLKNF